MTHKQFTPADDLKAQLEELSDANPTRSVDEVFVLWYLLARITDHEQTALDALTGASNDRGIDAVLVEHEPRLVTIVQGKKRQGWSKRAEKREDVVGFAAVARALLGSSQEWTSFSRGMDENVRRKLQGARSKIVGDGYRLELHYVTTGSCSPAVVKSATEATTHRAKRQVRCEIVTSRELGTIVADYTRGAAPPVRSVELPLETGNGVGATSVLQRADSKTGINSWVVSVSATAVVDLYQQAGVRLFARNVRGFLGAGSINDGMQQTLRKSPEYFWYYNNGITIICDDAEYNSAGRRAVLHLTNPQVINGQQTSRTLAEYGKNARHASVLVRVIQVPRVGSDRPAQFEELVSNVVAATNWQNAILKSDLRSNDARQIGLERALEKLKIRYLRKRMSKAEAKAAAGGRSYKYFLRKEELAIAVGACDLDPSIVRVEGKESLFGEEHYKFVFASSDPLYYLSRYWLVRVAGQASKGHPEWSYAKWLVAHYLWAQLSPAVGRGELRRAFIADLERANRSRLQPKLLALATEVYKASAHLYKAERGKGESAQDVSNFFRPKGLVVRLERHLRSQSNQGRRRSIGRSIRGFEAALRAVAQS